MSGELEALPEQLVLGDEAATQAVGARLGRAARPDDVVALTGPLGAGKSAFARAFIRARAGAEIEVPSPTFTLVQTYELASGVIWHVDLYRLAAPEEALELGLEDAFTNALCLIEWPERLGDMLPLRALTVRLDHAGTGRSLAFHPGTRPWMW
ncbi:MAG: tRNA (adenosine(37)-N6)-threonylcarbamoyltransferase complex ATPase subunit type 1 TsaE [Alphaproteobacteria bacterium]|nr:MAG: tRNA (adenosine(37)-N6)-threonylcarbamoyltransferase complex ATPase subunit type 1 TsaE [Alphaproteobacteria bacterium]